MGLLPCLAVLALLAGEARAEGPGLLLGSRIVVHPGLATEFRYDSNVFFTNVRVGGALPAAAFIMRLLPSIDISTLTLRRGGLTPHKVDFRFHAGMDYREYLTPDPNINRHRAIGVDLGAMLSLFPRSAFSVDLYDNFLRTNQPPFSFNPYNFDRHTNVFGSRMRYSPGGQRLVLSFVYELGYDGFEDVDGGPQLSDFNLLYNSFTLRGSWKFLPKTALFVELSQMFNTYLRPAEDGLRVNSFPLRTGGGIMGLVTQKLAVNLFGGYGNGFYERGPSPSTAVVQAEVKYKPTFMSAVTVGYRHDFVNSLLGSYFDLDAVSVNYSHLIYRLTLFVRFSWERMAFQGTPEQLAASGVCIEGEVMPCVPQLDRVDNYLLFDLKGELPIRDWLLPSVGYTLQSNVSNGYTRVQSVIAPVSFVKHEVWVRLTVRY
ncbi:MAG: hypothetical protein RMK29_03410 [Myxococcales bacterium]|nr:hypothetical protein [Myxococcota bacterium]MDW8280733.1 hypothetical protein [Myxococcales bacterium]